MSDIGEILKQARIKNGYSIEDINRHTKIRYHIIQAIEEGNYSILPPVYMKSFISDYMEFLGLNDNIEEVISELFPKDKKEILASESYHNLEKENNKEYNYNEIFSKKRRKKDFFNKTSISMYMLYLSILLIIVAVLYFAFFRDNDEKDTENIASQVESTQVIADEALIEKVETYNDSMSIRVYAKDTAWIRLSNDVGIQRQMVLFPGNEIQMSAWEFCTFSSDRADYIDVYRNGELLPKLNNQGSAVRNIKITRTDIVSPTSVYADSTIKMRRAIKKKKEEKKEKPYILQPSVINP